MDLSEIMATNFATVTPETTIGDAARRMLEIDTGAAVVLEGEELAGVISERDLLRGIRDGASADETVADRMTRHVMTAAPSTGLPEAMALMVDGHFRHLPIVDRRPRHRHDLDARPHGLGVAAPASRRLRGRRRRGHR